MYLVKKTQCSCHIKQTDRIGGHHRKTVFSYIVSNHHQTRQLANHVAVVTKIHRISNTSLSQVLLQLTRKHINHVKLICYNIVYIHRFLSWLHSIIIFSILSRYQIIFKKKKWPRSYFYPWDGLNTFLPMAQQYS